MTAAQPSPSGAERESQPGTVEKITQLVKVADATKTLVVAIAGIATALYSVWQSTTVGYAVALASSVLVVAILGYRVWRFRHPTQLRDGQPDTVPRGILRNSLPFARGPLPGRSDEAAGLAEMVTAADY